MRNTKLLMISMFLFLTHSLAQESIRTKLFGEVDELLAKVKKEQANIYAPGTFEDGMDEYKRADNDLKKGGNLEEIRKRIKKATTYFKKALEFAELARLSFGASITSRNDALAAKADQFAQDLWKDAEEKFRDAMEQMEGNDLNDAKEQAGEAESVYRQAELKAIEGNLLNPAKDLLTQAKKIDADNYAPITYKLSEKYIADAEKSLKENRYDRDEARKYAFEAKSEAQHAIYLTELIMKLRKKDNAFEELMLLSEKPLDKIAERLEIKVRFNEGQDHAADIISATIDSLKASNARYQDLILVQKDKVISLSEQISLMEQRLGKFTEAEEELRQKIEQKNQQEQKIRQIAQTITREEGHVLRDGDNVIIRLYGLNFQSGKSTIRPENFELLKKVQDGIRNFEGSMIIIEGHTDSRGSDAVNQKLSSERADAVMQYLIANMSLPQNRISAKAFGETKPVASNETEAGRAKNRRIDVVLIPAWAQR